MKRKMHIHKFKDFIHMLWYAHWYAASRRLNTDTRVIHVKKERKKQGNKENNEWKGNKGKESGKNIGHSSHFVQEETNHVFLNEKTFERNFRLSFVINSKYKNSSSCILTVSYLKTRKMNDET